MVVVVCYIYIPYIDYGSSDCFDIVHDLVIRLFPVVATVADTARQYIAPAQPDWLTAFLPNSVYNH